MSEKTTKIAQSTRTYRKLHKWIAVPLFLFMFSMGVTGLLLGWKKQTGILPKTEKGESSQSSEWIKIDSIQQVAVDYVQNELKKSIKIDRIDIRPQKGIAKIVFVEHFTELQIDCKTGKILAVNQRNSDIIEKIHDGSILDFLVKTDNDAFKLFYTTTLSLGLILLSISGFWLWYNPIRIRKAKK
jgi:hypothetical protein